MTSGGRSNPASCPAGTQLKTEVELQGGVRAAGPADLPDHGPRCDQAARRPWLGGDPTRPGTLRPGTQRPVRVQAGRGPSSWRPGRQDLQLRSRAAGSRYQTRPAREWRCSQPPPAIAQSLGLKGDDQVVSRHQRRSIDGTPYSMQTTYYPMTFLTDNAATRLASRPGTLKAEWSTISVISALTRWGGVTGSSCARRIPENRLFSICRTGSTWRCSKCAGRVMTRRGARSG